jgi:hypothetical protein
MVADGAGGLVDQPFKFPMWFEPIATGRTPMCQALGVARDALRGFVEKFPHCYPPLAINITDGMATDGDPQAAAQQIRGLSSDDGNVVLFNVHISASNALPVEFPNQEKELTDQFARLLFRMSSPLPPRLVDAARSDGYSFMPGTRGFVFNADLVSVIRFLDIGTRCAQPLAVNVS